ncbi:TPA: AAA family ATPase [Candidatus Micrarchaeota archaeon]|nr:AAA family ATPase [Candidatus Micrarchaeota archaeon]
MLRSVSIPMTSFDEILSRQSIFRNMSVLSPHYIPKDLPFREEQIREVMSIVSPALKGQKPRNLIIYGKTGTGKTSSIRRIMDEFANMEKDARMHYVNCRVYNSRYRIMQKIMKNYSPELDKAGFGLPTLYEKLLETTSKGHQAVIVLDEIDMVKDLDELVYTLTRANDEADAGGVSIIGISNKLSFKDVLDPRSRSSLYETEMVYPPYTSEQLRKILSQRVDGGFEKGVVEDSAVNLAAALTAQESGDARYALKLLMKAGEMAEQSGKSKVRDDEVEAARKKVELDLTAETVSTLPDMHRLVLYAAANVTISGSKYARLEGVEDGFLLSGEVYEEYSSLCKKVKKRARSTRWFREYLNDLEMLGLIITTPSSKGLRGHTTLIKLGQSAEDMLKIVQREFN